MSEHNIFQEIDEDLQRQKLEALWKRYGGYALALAVLIVACTAGITAWRSWSTERDEKATAALIELKNPAAHDDAAKQVDELVMYAGANHGKTQATFAQLHAAGLAIKENNQDKAIQIYDGVASDTKDDPAFRQLATLLSVRTQLDSGDPVIMEKRLQPLMAHNAPWRLSAMEYAGYLALRENDKAKAREIFTELAQDPGAPTTLAARAADMLRYTSD